jgi:hypothetical protein
MRCIADLFCGVLLLMERLVMFGNRSVLQFIGVVAAVPMELRE